MGMDVKSVMVGVVAGATVSYFVTKNLLEEKYLQIANREVEDAKEFYASISTVVQGNKEHQALVEDAIKGIQESASEAAASIREYQGIDINPDKLATEMVQAIKRDNTLVIEDTEYEIVEEIRPERPLKPSVPMPSEPADTKVKTDYRKKSAEAAKQSVVDEEADAVEQLPNTGNSKADPYQISFAVFDDPEDGYEKISLSYFEGDKVMVDETDTEVTPRRVNETITKKILDEFKSESDDPNVIYVRNETLNMDFEVTRSPGKYSE